MIMLTIYGVGESVCVCVCVGVCVMHERAYEIFSLGDCLALRCAQTYRVHTPNVKSPMHVGYILLRQNHPLSLYSHVSRLLVIKFCPVF